jgi:hypothetical protein
MAEALSEFRVQPALRRNDKRLKRPAGGETFAEFRSLASFLGIPAGGWAACQCDNIPILCARSSVG